MARLKNILIAALREENETHLNRAEQLFDVLKNNYRTELPILFRGDPSGNTDTFQVRDIRKNRHPRDTEDKVDTFLEVYRKHRYPNFPSRRSSKFAVTLSDPKKKEQKISRINQYGDPYFVFIEQDAPVISRKNDSFSLLSPMRTQIKTGSRIASALFKRKNSDLEQEIEKKYPELLDFLYLLHGQSHSPQEFGQLFDSNFEAIIEQVSEFEKYRSKVDSVALSHNIKRFCAAFDYAKRYFEDAKFGVIKNSDEVMFSGNSYVLVDIDFFLENFRYENNKLMMI